MAKDKSGFMSVDIGLASDPAAAPTSLIEQSGAYEGKAAELGGIKVAEAVTHFTKEGKAAYEGWVETQAAKKAKEVTDKLYAPELGFVGPTAYKADMDARAAMENLKPLLTPDPETNATAPSSGAVQMFNEEARRIAMARDQDILTQKEAQARLATNMRELIAAYPGDADRIRKTYNSYTGRNDWDYRPIEQALTKEVKADQAAKDKLQRDEKAAWEYHTKGIGVQFGIKTYEEMLRVVQKEDDLASRVGTAYAATALTEHANKSMTTGAMNEYFNTAMVGAGAARTGAVSNIVEKMKLRGLDLLNTSSITEAQRPLLEEAYREMKAAERNSLEGSLKLLEMRVAKEPHLDAAIVSDIRDKLKKQLENTPLTADMDSMFNELKMHMTAHNMKADTILKTSQIRDLSLKTTWSDDMLNRMKDPRTRAQLVADYPNNPFVKELAGVFDGRQSNFSKELKNMEMLADGLFNDAAPWAHKAAVAEARTTAQGRQQIAAVTQLEAGKGKQVLEAGAPATPNGASAAVVAATHFNINSAEGKSVYNYIVSGKVDDKTGVFERDTSKLDAFKTAAKERTERFLANVDDLSYPKKVKEALDVATARKTGVSLEAKDGIIVLKNARMTGNIGADEAILKLDKQVGEVNKLLQIQNKLTDSSTRAQRFIDEVNTGVPKQKGVVQSVLDASPDMLRPTSSVASQADVRKAEPVAKPTFEIKTKEDALAELTKGTITGAQYDLILREMAK